MAVAIFPIVMLVAGLLMWAFVANAKLAEVGRMMVFCGLLGLTFVYAGASVRVGDSVSRR